jgi:hypothetical protein
VDRCRHIHFLCALNLGCSFALVGIGAASGQSTSGVSGPLLAQNAQIEQSRLYDRTTGPDATGMTPDGMALPGTANGNSDDESFGAQQMLKTQQRVREFVLSGDSSMFYTNNVALTRRDMISDGFFVGGAGLGWSHAINPQMQLQVGGRVSLFRYVDTSSLDFENLSAGIGFNWIPQPAWGITVFARYDFTELLDKHSRELLQDHEFTLGAQKVFAINRVHSFTLGASGSVGISDPFSAQRDQISAFGAYHLSFTQQLDAELAYRIGGFFYNGGGRNDFNQAVSLGMRYRFTSWMEANALFTFASNRSSKSVFDYDVLNTGGSVGFAVRF